MLGLFVLTLAAAAVSGQTPCCPDGWVVFEGSCYYFTHDTPVDFIEAENYCNNHGGHLVNIGGKDEDLFVRDFIRRFNETSFWMGLTDEIVEGLWKWRDSDKEATYTNWSPGEPNSFHAINEDCAVFYQPSNYAWVDSSCLARLAPICELELQNGGGGVIG